MAEEKGIALVILGIISVIAVIGLVLLFSGAKGSVGAATAQPKPALQTTVQACTFASGSAGWKDCMCPTGWLATGGAGYSCELIVPGKWGCIGTAAYTDHIAFYHDGSVGASVWVWCAK